MGVWGGGGGQVPAKVPAKPRVGCAGTIGQEGVRKSTHEGFGTSGGHTAWWSARRSACGTPVPGCVQKS